MLDPRILIAVGTGLVGVALAVYLVHRWAQLKNRAKNWLSEHPGYVKVVCGAIECAANVKCGVKKYVMPILGIDSSGVRTVRITEEEIDERQLEKYEEQVRKDPVLAVLSLDAK